MRLPTFVNALDLEQWADYYNAPALFPRIIRRLILATTPNARVSFRTGEGVRLRGWDGIVETYEASAFVPDGVSGWELSTAVKVNKKVEEDYRKRVQDSIGLDPRNTTFVFVTPRRWPEKKTWEEERRREKIWKDVRVYDADDLEHWLEQTPSVHVWLSRLLGKHPEGVLDLETFWKDWSSITVPEMSPSLILAGRGQIAQEIENRLDNPSGILALKADTREEALAVFAAAVMALPEEKREKILPRILVSQNPQTLEHLASLLQGSSQGLIIVVDFDNVHPELISRAIRYGHLVVYGLGKPDDSQDAVLIPPLSRVKVAEVLEYMRLRRDEAWELARLMRRSLAAFRRRRTRIPGIQKPPWALPDQGRQLVPVMLAGYWNDAMEGDQQAIAILAGRSYGEVLDLLTRWVNQPDPPVKRKGNVWHVVDRYDSWLLLRRYITRDDVERFKNVVLRVFSTPDPQYDLPVKQRWMARALGKVPLYSGYLQKGLAETLVLMSIKGEDVDIGTGIILPDIVNQIVSRVLEDANQDWRIWASISGLLPLLAEAAPEAFLKGVEEGLKVDSPILRNLFTDEEENLLGSFPHTGLLWALETLAWSPQYIGQSSLLLAHLARIDPGGRLVNRPLNSLGAILRPWEPQTTASLDQRLDVIDMLRQREPEIAWQLLVGLVPKRMQGIAFTTVKPQWREWAAELDEESTMREYPRAVSETVHRLLEDIGEDGARWKDLIKALPDFPPNEYKAVVKKMESLDVKTLSEETRIMIWDELRQLISDHRSYPDARWALPKNCLDRLERISRKFRPKDPVILHAWLFARSPKLPVSRGDIDKYFKNLLMKRQKAVREIFNQQGIEGILHFASQVESPFDVGYTLGHSALPVEENDLLKEYLGAEERYLVDFVCGFVHGRVDTRGRDWAVEKLRTIEFSSKQQAMLLLCLPADPQTWDLAEQLGSQTEQFYWKLTVNLSKSDIERAARQLLKYNRPYSAIEFLAHKPDSPALLLAEALEKILETPSDSDRPTEGFAYAVVQTMKRLAESPDIDEERIARLEWAFLPLFRWQEYRPKTLFRKLQRSPEFFVEVMCVVYLGEGEEPGEITEEMRLRAERGRELLDSWRDVPGLREGNDIDAAMLKEWVRRAREILRQKRRLKIGDEIIGQMLSGAPPGADGVWPHPAVRDLIEELESKDLERGIMIGVFNKRGVYVKSPFEGGEAERRIAKQYSEYAAQVAARWPRTAAVLRQIARDYERQAYREDLDAEIREEMD